MRQYVLTLPYELRKLVAFKADVLTAIARIFVESIFVTYRTRAKRAGLEGAECGAVNFVQRFGGLNLHVHFHCAVLDGVFTRDADGRVLFHPAPAATVADLEAIVARVQRRSAAWLRRHGYLDHRPIEDRSNEPPSQTALKRLRRHRHGTRHALEAPGRSLFTAGQALENGVSLFHGHRDRPRRNG